MTTQTHSDHQSVTRIALRAADRPTQSRGSRGRTTQRRWVRAESVLMHVDSACTAALARMAPLRVAATELAERAAERERGGASAAEVEDGRNGDGALAEGAGEEGAPSEGGTPSEAYTPSEVSVEVAGSPPRSRVDGMSALGRSNGATSPSTPQTAGSRWPASAEDEFATRFLKEGWSGVLEEMFTP